MESTDFKLPFLNNEVTSRFQQKFQRSKIKFSVCKKKKKREKRKNDYKNNIPKMKDMNCIRITELVYRYFTLYNSTSHDPRT
jgi:hypothetical protein